MFLSVSRTLYLCIAALLLIAATGHAATVEYTDPVAWMAAVSGTTAIGFEGLAPAGGFKDYSTSTGYVITNGPEFIGFEGPAIYGLQVIDSADSSPYFNWGTGASLESPGYNAPPNGFTPYIHVILPANITAFGVDLMTVSPNALTYQVTLDNGNTYTVTTANRPTQTFFGITSDSPIAYINFAVIGTTNGNGTYGLMDNFTYGTADDATQTPELCTFLLIGSGLATFGYLGRRRRSRNISVTALA